MSRFIYLLSEGVHDVTFLIRVLTKIYGGSKVKYKSKLDEPRRQWIDSFKWPLGDDIERLSVPAPQFVHIPSEDTLVGLRNSGGIDNLIPTLELDLEALYRKSALPDAIGVFLDSDEEPQEQRFKKLRGELLKVSAADSFLQVEDRLASVGSGSPRIGVFAFPSPGAEGALEDLLLELGQVPYGELCKRAAEYVRAWQAHVESDRHKDWRELKGQSGMKKATFAATTAILKPGRGAVATINDNRWVGDETKDHAALAPCLDFLRDLLTPPTTATAIQGTTP